MFQEYDWALIVPMANEEKDFAAFVGETKKALDGAGSGTVYLVVDNASKDRTLGLCRALSKEDDRFQTVWVPENRNVVDAYINGYRAALENSHEYFIEMDAGLSHDPASLPQFLRQLGAGYECVFGSRFIKGGSMGDSPFKRRMLSKAGTVLSNMLLGTRLHDMTSGYQGFDRKTAEQFTAYPLRSQAHFYQTEIRYLLRNKRAIEIPIAYQAPSPRVSRKAIDNAISTLLYYLWRRITLRAIALP